MPNTEPVARELAPAGLHSNPIFWGRCAPSGSKLPRHNYSFVRICSSGPLLRTRSINIDVDGQAGGRSDKGHLHVPNGVRKTCGSEPARGCGGTIDNDGTDRTISPASRLLQVERVYHPTMRSSVSSPRVAAAVCAPSRGRVEVLRSGQPGMDAGLAAPGHGWPMAAGPRSRTGARACRALAWHRTKGQEPLVTWGFSK